MSAREELVEKVLSLINELGLNTSPAAGSTNLSSDKKYRSVSLGWARFLDAEVRIYSATYFVYRDSRDRFQKLASWDELETYLRRLARNFN